MAVFFSLQNLRAQNTSYNCRRDTTVACNLNTLNLRVRIPDVAFDASGANYTVRQLVTATFGGGGCLRIPVAPDAPGNPVSISIDDTYSPPIDLGFNFPFFGTDFNKVVVSTNGYISFDVGLANNDSHWQVTADLPSGNYDRGLIMGAYHDLDPSENTSPTQQIKFDVIGVAPNRRFVFSFFKVPLFICASLIQNTQQIVMYEGTGIIDVYIYDKEICSGWNGGKGIVGLQSFDKTKGVMAPNRAGSSPPWGSIGMNEVWRFTPTGDPSTSLFKRVELIDFAGNLIANGNVAGSAGGELNVIFNNLTVPNAVNSYIVKSYYSQFNDPNVDIIGFDTIIVRRGQPDFTIATNTSNLKCSGDNSGSITFTSPIGPTFSYSINGGVTFQASPIFNGLAAATYNLSAKDGLGALCAATASVDLTEPAKTRLTNVASLSTNCSNSTGRAILTVTGGTPAYQFALRDSINYQSSDTFKNLAVGTYTFKIKDANGCTDTFATPFANIILNDTMRLTLPADTNVCIGSSVKLLPSTNDETSIFKWTPGAPKLDFDSVKTPIATLQDTSKFVLVAKWGLCTRTDSMIVNILKRPKPNAGNDTTICYRSTATLRGSVVSVSGAFNIMWSPSEFVNPNNTFVTLANPDTSRWFVLTTKDLFGCNFTDIDSVKVNMRDPVNAFAGNDTIAILGQPHQLEGSGGVTFRWYPPNTLNNSLIENPLTILNNDQYFTLNVTDNIGCVGTDGVFVRAIKGPNYYVPTAFSPNGDGLNDVFRVTSSGIIRTEYFRVFDRLGNLMFETKQPQRGWNGLLNGSPAAQGTYVWLIKGYDHLGKAVSKTGTVVLLR